MALSQIQCLDDNNVNPRTHESKPEFFYCEDQRLALETLLRDGRENFFKYLEARGLRGFLSDLELEALSAAVEPYDPGKDLFPENFEGEPTPLSQHYWPDLSDTSIPEMDLGWPDTEGYRGVTRTTVYTQPPLDGQAHIKEVVRKMISQAQKVIAVVMDVFTDVDIFRDLIDVGFKKRVSVYILLERTNLPHFLSMCRRANMHSGHLKHLRVRCTEGAEFCTRSCTKVRGRLGHRFMFVDGDKAVSGSYSFTWMSSRLDRNLITVTTGQAVDGFDRLFRYLYANSSSVDLRQVVMEPEPEPEVLPQPVTVVLPSATVARKMYNPKYALVAASNPSPTTSVGRQSHENLKQPETSENPKKKKRRMAIEEEVLPIHPGLVNLEKAYLIPYLPTWPEPDPSSDVIGFINIRDANKPTQVHLQRSEMFETSKAIRFSSPFSNPSEALPEVTKPRQLTVKAEEMSKSQPALNKTITAEVEVNKAKAKEFTVDKVLPAHLTGNYGDTKSKEKTPEQILPDSVPKSLDFYKETIKALTGNKEHTTNTAANKVPGSETPHISAHIGLTSSSKTPITSKGTASHIPESLSRNSPKSESLRESDSTKKADTVSSLNTEGVAVYRPHTLESNSTHTSQLPGFSSSNSKTVVETQEKTVTPHTEAVRMKPSSGSASSPVVNSPFIPQNNPTSMTKTHSNTTAGASVFTDRAPLSHNTQSLTTRNPSRSSSTSSSLTSPLPVPKPRTVQLLINDDSSNSQVCLVKKPETSSETQVIHNEPSVQTAVPSSPVKGPDSKAGTQTYSEHSRTTKETAHPKESLTSKETKSKEADGRLDAKSPYQPKDSAGRSTLKLSADTLNEQGKQAVFTPAHSQDTSPQDTQSSFQELISKARGNVETPDKTLRLQLTDTHVPGLNTQSPDRESQSILSPVRTPTPDRFSPRVATADARTPTPEQRSYASGFRTPTSDVSDGYVSSRDDSNLSTTSDEYYECSDSPYHEPVFENIFSSTSPTCQNSMLSTTDRSAFWSETQAFAEPDRGSASSVIDKRVKMRQAKDEDNEKGKEEKVRKPSVVRKTEQESQETDRRDFSEADKIVDQRSKYKNSTETAEKVEEAHSPKKKEAFNQSATDRRVASGESTTEGAGRTRLSSGDLKPMRVASEGQRPAKVPTGREKVSNQEGLRSSAVERREKAQSSRETEEQKTAQQHDVSPSSRPPRPSRPLSGNHMGSHPWANRPLNQTQSKVLEILESRKTPSRPPPPSAAAAAAAAAAGSAGPATGQRPVPQNQQGSASRQPPAVQGKMKPEQTQSQTSHQKPQSFLHTRANMQSQSTSPTQSQVVAAAKAHGQDEGKGPFSLSISRLYNLTGLKMNKTPAQGKSGSSQSPAGSRKSTS